MRWPVSVDQMGVSEDLKPYFCWPSVRASEILEFPQDVRCGLTLECIRALVIESCHLDIANTVVPTSSAWPMDFALSSFIAQSVMVDAWEVAGAQPSHFITDKLTVQDPSLPSFSVATDDVLRFQAAWHDERPVF